MKLHCTYSGIEWNAEGFSSVRLSVLQMPHPIFSIPLSSLLSRSGDFYSGKLSDEEKRLLFLATLNASRLIQWRSHATPTNAIIVQYYDQLARIVSWIDMYDWNEYLGRRRGPAFPQFVISNETRGLENIRFWLQSWIDARGEYEAGQAKEDIKEKQKRRETALYRLINSANRDITSYSKLIAGWAADAAEFPTNIFIALPTSGENSTPEQISLRDYWIRVMTDPRIYSVRLADLKEIEDHLIENLDLGTIYATAALKLVREKMRRGTSSLGLEDYFSAEDVDAILQQPFTITNNENSSPVTHRISRPANIEEQNIAAAASLAPETKPQRQEYPDTVTYLRALARWTLANN